MKLERMPSVVNNGLDSRLHDSAARYFSVFAARKAAEVPASLPQFNVGNVVNGLTAAAATRLFAVRPSHRSMLPRATGPSAGFGKPHQRGNAPLR
jgi:hypothetical protein